MDKALKNSQSLRTAVLSTTEGREFHNKAKRIAELENISQILLKDAKQLSERDVEVFKAEKKLSSDIMNCSMFREDPSMTVGLSGWQDYLNHHEDHLATQTADIQKVMVDPLKKLNSGFPHIHASLRKRDQLLMDYDKWYQKVERTKKKEKTGQNIVKLDNYQKNLKVAKEEFEAHNSYLQSFMSSLYDGRTEYLSPSLHALIDLQIKHIGECYKAYSELEEAIKLEKSPGDMQNKFSELGALSIVDASCN